MDVKATLVAELGKLHDAVRSKLHGLGEYDLRRPLTRSGTNLLGVVKHLSLVQAGYFGDCFDRPWPRPFDAWAEGAAINDDMWATPEESTDEIVELFDATWDHALATFAVTDLDVLGTVPWWPEERRHPPLATVMAHMLVELARHAGQLDVVRELVDGAIGRYQGDGSIPGDDEIDWPAYVDKVEAAARSAAQATAHTPTER